MKSKVISGMMLTLLIVNVLAMRFIITPTVAATDAGRDSDDFPLCPLAKMGLSQRR
jgi:hypothetical protein